jgi:large subunit ribosomal protein L10
MPSAAVLEQKKAIVEALAEEMKGAASVVLVNYQGITVEDDTKLRSELRKAGVEYKVIKNTLISRASKIAGLEGLNDVLNGMTAIAICKDDQIAPARVLGKYAKGHDNFVLKAGFIDGKLVDAEELKKLSELPSKEILVATVLGTLNAPITSLAVAIKAIADQKGA